jgi:hypothetical protein
MKKTNPIAESQKLRGNLSYERKRRKKSEKENKKLRKENSELKKNLENF